MRKVFLLPAILLALAVNGQAGHAGVLNKAMDRVINSVDPNADANSRNIAKETARSVMSPTQRGAQEHLDNARGYVEEGFGNGATDSPSNSVAGNNKYYAPESEKVNSITAYDLEGNWILTSTDENGKWAVTRSDNYQIAIKATSSTSFTGRYITINNDNIFDGTINGSNIVVKQRYADGRHYATYTLTTISTKKLAGACIDIYNDHYNPVWERKKVDHITAYDLNGSWITQAREGYQIRIMATSDTAFEAHYTNINNDNVFKGDLHVLSSPPSLTVRQFYGDGRLYGTYSLATVSSNEITGTLIDYTGNRGTVVWRRHK